MYIFGIIWLVNAWISKMLEKKWLSGFNSKIWYSAEIVDDTKNILKHTDDNKVQSQNIEH